MPPIPMLAPEYLHSLPAPNCTPDTPTPLTAPDTLLTPYTSKSPLMTPIPMLAPEYIHSLSDPQCTPCQPLDTPYTPASGGI